MITKIFWYFLICSIYISGEDLNDCDSEIFCQGDILKTIQLAKPPIRGYEHSANFVETKLTRSPDNILTEFESIKSSVDNDRNLLEAFVDKNFKPDLPDKCKDFNPKEKPEFEAEVESEIYKEFVTTISGMWSKLLAETSDDVKDRPEYHSLVYLPKCFVKSDEFISTTNYSDNYWVIRGLLENGMTKIAAGMIENYAYLIEKNSFVLHSNRVYSSKRTQIPLLALMMENYYDKTKDSEFLLKHLQAMDKEFQWWKKHRFFTKTVGKKLYRVFQFNQRGDKPRPEAYREDYQLASKVYGLKNKNIFFSTIRAIDESGLGFCSRFKRELKRTWASVLVTDLIPVDLNSILQRYAFLLGQWFKNVKNDIIAGRQYEKLAEKIAKTIDEVLWNENKHMWLDYDLSKGRHQTSFSPTNLMPLFTMSYYSDQAKVYSDFTLKYLQNEGIIDENFQPLHWIIPASTENTGSIWDFPYGSPPQTLYVIEGLTATLQQDSEDLALELAKALLKTIYVGYAKKNTLHKQYSAIELGKGVNERETATVSKAGYAWTNSAVLVMLEWYGKWLQPSDYLGFKPSLQHTEPVEEKIQKRRKRKDVEFTVDDDFGPSSNTAASPEQLPQRRLRKKPSKLYKYSESDSSSYEVPLVQKMKKKNPKVNAAKSANMDETKPSLNELSSSRPKPRPKKNLQSKAVKREDEFEPPPSEAAESEPAKMKRRRRKDKNVKIEEYPLNEVTPSEQPRQKKVVRKASKKFVDESDTSQDEPVPAQQTTAKKRERKLDKLSDYEESEPPSDEVGEAVQPRGSGGKRRKSSKPTRGGYTN